MGILFGHFLKCCCCHNTCEKRVSVISTFPQPAQDVRWSLDFLPPYWQLLAPKRFSSYNLISEKLLMLPVSGNYWESVLSPLPEALPSLDSLNTFTWTRRHDIIILALPAILLLGYSAPGSRIARMEIQVFWNEDISQTNSYLHYSNYSYSRLTPNKRALG